MMNTLRIHITSQSADADSNDVFIRTVPIDPQIPGQPTVSLIPQATQYEMPLSAQEWVENDHYVLVMAVRGAERAPQDVQVLPRYTPLRRFQDGEEGLLVAGYDMATLWQDSTRTVPVDSVGQPVRVLDSIAPGGLVVAASNDAGRGVFARMPRGGVRNEVIWSRDLTRAVWPKGNGIASIAYDAGSDSTTVVLQSGSKSISQDFTVSPGEQRTVRLRASQSIAGSSSIRLRDNTATETILEERYPESTPGEDFVMSIEFVVPAGCTSIRFYPVYGGTDGAEIEIKDVQFELGAPSPFQRVTDQYDITETGVPDVYHVNGNSTDALYYISTSATDPSNAANAPSAGDYTVAIAGTEGIWIEEVEHGGGVWSINYGTGDVTNLPSGILTQVGEFIGATVIDRSITQVERGNLVAFYRSKGSPGVWKWSENLFGGNITVVGSEWTDNGDGSYTSGSPVAGTGLRQLGLDLHDGDYIHATYTANSESGAIRMLVYGDSTITHAPSVGDGEEATIDVYRTLIAVGGSHTNGVFVQAYPSPGFVGTVSNISVRKLELIL